MCLQRSSSNSTVFISLKHKTDFVWTDILMTLEKDIHLKTLHIRVFFFVYLNAVISISSFIIKSFFSSLFHSVYH